MAVQNAWWSVRFEVTHLIRVEYKSTDVSVTFALELLYGFRRRHAGDNDVSFLL